MKNTSKKGITLIELVVVIIILILLAVIAIWNTNSSMTKAEAMVVINEFKAVYQAVSVMRDNYNLGYDTTLGKDYCEILPDASGDWYVVYGIDSPAFYNDEVVTKYLGIDELKRSYDFRWMAENGHELNDIEIRFHGGKHVDVAGYSIGTYEELRSIQSEIAK